MSKLLEEGKSSHFSVNDSLGCGGKYIINFCAAYLSNRRERKIMQEYFLDVND